ncbi:MAG: hypothetical protein QXT92_00390 [Nitrososphaerota archaeon]
MELSWEHVLLLVIILTVSAMAYLLHASWRDYVDALLAILAVFGFSAYYYYRRRVEEHV